MANESRCSSFVLSNTVHMNIIESLQWRYATKRMTGQKVPEGIINNILESIRLAPSGIGLQPYEVFVITTQVLKEKIYPIAFNQAPVLECSHLLVFAAWDNYTPGRINHVFDYLNTSRSQASSVSERQRQFALNYFAGFSQEQNFHHAAKQAHIGLGIAVAAAALQQIDTTPMEGFNAAQLDELLQLPQKGLRSSMLMAIGYRSESNDWNLPLKKVRKPMEELITYL